MKRQISTQQVCLPDSWNDLMLFGGFHSMLLLLLLQLLPMFFTVAVTSTVL